jgi:hypothetical protein
MTLGFTVDALVRAGRGGGAVRMGLSRVSAGAWLWPEFDRVARAEALSGPGVVQALAGSASAQAEVAALVGVDGDLRDAAAATWEDLCVIERDGDGRFVLTAGAVAFPTDWRLADKMGLPVAAIHAPIHGYAEQLSAGVDHFLDTLTPGPVFGRANWFVVASDALHYLPDNDAAERFAHVTAGNAGETLFVRCERQTLRTLPQTGAVLFTIGIAVARLDAVEPATLACIAAGIAAQPVGEQGRKAAPFYASALADYAARRSTDRLEAA